MEQIDGKENLGKKSRGTIPLKEVLLTDGTFDP
jgi:hypothetical protein